MRMAAASVAPMGVACLGFIVAFVTQLPVASAKETIGILPIESTKYPVLAQRLTSELRSAAKAHSSFKDKGDVDFSLSEVRLSFSCFDEAPICMAQVGKTLKVEVLVWGKITQTATSLRAQLTGMNVGDQTTFHQATYYFPDQQSFTQNVLGAAKAFVERRPFHVKQMYTIKVETIPSGAQIAIDGSGKGPSPQTIRLPAGGHRLSVRLQGYQTARRLLTPSKPMDRVVIRLTKRQAAKTAIAEPEMHSAVEPVIRKSRWPMWTGIGLGVAAAGLAGVSIYYWIEAIDLTDEQKSESESVLAQTSQVKTQVDDLQRIPVASRTEEQQNQLNASTDQYNALLKSFNSAQSSRIDDFETANTIMITTGVLAGVTAAASLYFLVIHKTDDAKVSVGPGQVSLQVRF